MSREKFRLLSHCLLVIIVAVCLCINVLYGNISFDILIRFITTYCVVEFFVEKLFKPIKEIK